MPQGDRVAAISRVSSNVGLIKMLTYLMFMMFAMTTDSAGVIIPEIIKEFHLSMAQAGAFHYATMAGIALAGLGLGFLADRLGRKATIILGLVLFAANAFLFLAGNRFEMFLVLLLISGASIGIFKTGALALIGDVSTSTESHTRVMNMVEGFFGVGAIIGPAIVTQLLAHGASWKWLFTIAGLLCIGLILVAAVVRYPSKTRADETPITLAATVRMIGNPFALIFSAGAMLYVGVETAIYVWMPTLLQGYHGSYMLLSTYALSAFFVLRAGGRFLGSFMLAHMKWSLVLVLCAGAIFACFAYSYFGGMDAAVWSLPLSGLFMSVIYPTLNSKGISCFPKNQHGAVSGVILFFTCLSAVLSPLAMGAISDAFGDAKYGFVLATAFSALLFAFLVFNLIKDPTKGQLARLNETEYCDDQT